MSASWLPGLSQCYTRSISSARATATATIWGPQIFQDFVRARGPIFCEVSSTLCTALLHALLGAWSHEPLELQLSSFAEHLQRNTIPCLRDVLGPLQPHEILAHVSALLSLASFGAPFLLLLFFDTSFTAVNLPDPPDSSQCSILFPNCETSKHIERKLAWGSRPRGTSFFSTGPDSAGTSSVD